MDEGRINMPDDVLSSAEDTFLGPDTLSLAKLVKVRVLQSMAKTASRQPLSLWILDTSPSFPHRMP